MSRRGALSRVLAMLVVTSACSSGGPLTIPSQGLSAPTHSPAEQPAAAGSVRIAIPETVGSFADPFGDDVAAQDLAALWGLPLYRLDEHGQWRPGLVSDASSVEVDGEFEVTLDLHPGVWSDGSAVTANDLVATVEARRTGPQAARWVGLLEAFATDSSTAVLRFEDPDHNWPELLGPIGVLPASVLETDGLSAFDQIVPVSGGWFRVTEHVPGLRTRLEAHREGPLGAPGLESIEMLVVPSYETGLGLLNRDEVDVVLGHLALNAVQRADRVEGVQAATPIGGTTVALIWRSEASLSADRRRTVGDAVDLRELVEGLVGAAGAVATSPWPGTVGPWQPGEAPSATPASDILGAYVRGHEALGFTGRALGDQIRQAGGELRLVSENSPEVLRLLREDYPLGLRILRTGPTPSLLEWVDDPAELAAVDGLAPRDSAARDRLFNAAREAARVTPLYRIGVAHVWREDVLGLRPSSWPGLGLWNAGEWRRATP